MRFFLVLGVTIVLCASGFACCLFCAWVVLPDEEPQVISEYDLGKGLCLKVKAVPGEHGWAFLYEVKQQEAEIIPWTYFGTGRKRHVKRDLFKIWRVEGTDLIALYEPSDPACLFLIFDVMTLNYSTVAAHLPNQHHLIGIVHARVGNRRDRLDNFWGSDPRRSGRE